MRSTLKFLLALAVAFILMFAFRALVFTIYYVDCTAMEPVFKSGDCVMVNRWSYGLRTGGEGIFPYGRLCRQQVEKGDLIAVEDSLGQVLLFQCLARPGDTVKAQNRTIIVPGVRTCAIQDYYYVQAPGRARRNPVFVPECSIIGRACLIVYNHAPHTPMWTGYDHRRFLLPK